jgi:DNA-binding GntR family transcriptional regulator
MADIRISPRWRDGVSALDPIGKRPESLTERVYVSIREAIISRKLKPGDRVTEASLARQLHVSKTPVREALLQLEYIGLIESGSSGDRVVLPSYESIRGAYDVRIGLEVQVTRILAVHGDRDTMARAETYAQSCLAAAQEHDRVAYRAHERSFHSALAVATRNRLLTKLVDDTYDLTSALRHRDTATTQDTLDLAEQHLVIVQAAMAGDEAKAADQMRDHLLRTQRMVVEAFEAEERARQAGESVGETPVGADPR